MDSGDAPGGHTAIEEHARDTIDALIPHRHVAGNAHGSRTDGGFRWDMQVDAGGREQVLDELQRRSWDYLAERYEVLLTAWDERAPCGVYFVEDSDGVERNLQVLFSNKTALQAVRFRSFLADSRRVERPAAELAPHIEVETAAVATFLRRELQDIEANTDPAVVRLRPRRKVILSPKAAKDLKDLL